MANKTKSKLDAKHWKALELYEEGILSYKEIADKCGIPRETMYDLIEGNTKKQGKVAHLFKEEISKITARSSTKVRHLVKDSQKIALEKLNEWLRQHKNKKPTDKLVKSVLKAIQTLSKATPKVQIDSFSYTKGMTPEELRYEFQRLTSIAENSLNTRPVREVGKEGQGDVLSSTTGRGTTKKG